MPLKRLSFIQQVAWVRYWQLKIQPGMPFVPSARATPSTSLVVEQLREKLQPISSNFYTFPKAQCRLCSLSTLLTLKHCSSNMDSQDVELMYSKLCASIRFTHATSNFHLNTFQKSTWSKVIPAEVILTAGSVFPVFLVIQQLLVLHSFTKKRTSTRMRILWRGLHLIWKELWLALKRIETEVNESSWLDEKSNLTLFEGFIALWCWN